MSSFLALNSTLPSVLYLLMNPTSSVLFGFILPLTSEAVTCSKPAVSSSYIL